MNIWLFSSLESWDFTHELCDMIHKYLVFIHLGGFLGASEEWVDTSTNPKKEVRLQPREKGNAKRSPQKCECEHLNKLSMLFVFRTFARVTRCHDQNPDSQHHGTFHIFPQVLFQQCPSEKHNHGLGSKLYGISSMS